MAASRAEHRRLLAKYGTSRDGHAIFAPSGAKAWLNCLGSLLAGLEYEDDAGIDAAYGTVAHALAEEALKTGETPWFREGEVHEVKNAKDTEPFSILVDLEMLDYVEGYRHYCTSRSGVSYVEQRVDLSWMLPIHGQGGTSDHFTCYPDRLVITDLKMGRGVQVFAEENPQAMLYGAGVFEIHDWAYGFKEIEIRIYQPRKNHFDVWVCSRERMLEFIEYVRERAKAAWSENAPRTPSPGACQWCKARHNCVARLQQIEELMRLTQPGQVVSEDEQTEILNGLTFAGGPAYRIPTDVLAKLLLWEGSVKEWFTKGREELRTRMINQGEPAPGWHTVFGNASRAWKDKHRARKKLLRLGVPESQVETRKLISPAQAETVLKAKGIRGKMLQEMLDPIVDKRSGMRTIAPIKGDQRMDSEEEARALLDDASDEI